MLVELIRTTRVKTLSRLWLQLLRYYFRVEVEGMDHIPERGKALIVANHSGFAGADAVLLAHLIKQGTRRRARLMAHRAFFDFSKQLKQVSEYFGLKKASVSVGAEILRNGRLLIIFPEGESGNFKPSTRRYQLRHFHTGYLRMAVEAQAPIIPCMIVGAEEAHLNLGNIDFSKFIKGIKIPLPLNFVPLPAKWKIVFLPPIQPPGPPEDVLKNDRLLKLEALKLQRLMQRELIRRVKRRPYVYTRNANKMLEHVKTRVRRMLPKRNPGEDV